MPKAYSYIRFSTPQQQGGDSLHRQIELSKKYANTHGLELDSELKLQDLGVSAFDRSNLVKGTLGVFLKYVDEGKIDKGSYLLVESLDRLSRDKVMDALPVFLSILNAGITIVTLADGQVYSHEKASDNWGSLIMSIVIMSRAYEESAIKSSRIRSSWDSKRQNIKQKRLTSRCPYWLKPTEGAAGFETIPERVSVVKRIFQLSKDGVGNSTIVKILNSEKVPRFSDKTDGWQNSYIQKILSNRAVYGELQLTLQRDGNITPLEVIEDYYPAIMKKEDWLLIEAKRISRRTRGGVRKGKHLSNLFSGILKCGYCGSPMNMGGYVNKKTNGEKRIGKYVACSRGRRGMGCKYIQWNYSDLESFILQYCKSVDFASALSSNNSNESKIEEAKKKKLLLNENICGQEQSLNNFIKAIGTATDGMDMTHLVQSVSDATKTIATLRKEYEALEIEEARILIETLSSATFQSTFEELISHMNGLKDNELHQFRIKLSDLVQQSVSEIHLFPWGKWHPKKEDDERKSLEDSGYSKEQINLYFEQVNSIPKSDFRYMEMKFINGEVRIVSAKTNVLLDFNKETGECSVLKSPFDSKHMDLPLEQTGDEDEER